MGPVRVQTFETSGAAVRRSFSRRPRSAARSVLSTARGRHCTGPADCAGCDFCHSAQGNDWFTLSDTSRPGLQTPKVAEWRAFTSAATKLTKSKILPAASPNLSRFGLSVFAWLQSSHTGSVLWQENFRDPTRAGCARSRRLSSGRTAGLVNALSVCRRKQYLGVDA
jgi:hypothetical protein